MADFKNTPELKKKLDLLTETLIEADNSALKNNAFFSNLTEISTILDEMQRLTQKYLDTSAFKRKFIASDTRHKLKNLQYSLTFQIRLIDTIYVNPPLIEMQNLSNSGVARNNFNFK